MKLCSRCKKTQPVDQFGRNTSTKNGLKYFCKQCVNDLHRVWAEENPDKVIAARDRARDRRKRAYELLRLHEGDKASSS